MRAVGYQRSLPADDPEALVDIELPVPEPDGRDLLVGVRAVSVNPVDTKVRLRAVPEPGGWKVLGFDAAGVVIAAGTRRRRSSGRATRSSTPARSRGRGPTRSSTWSTSGSSGRSRIARLGRGGGAAADGDHRLGDALRPAGDPPPGAGAAPVLLIIGGAGGVGSMAVQLARRLTHLTVVATASRPESRAWASELGAHHVIDHGQPLRAAGRGARARGAGARLLDHPHRAAHRARSAADRAAGALRLYRRRARRSTRRRSRRRACRSASNRCSPGRSTARRT